MHIAARNNNAGLAQLFLFKGSNVNRAALHIASRRNSAQIVSALLIAGADPLCQTRTGLTPLHEAVISGAVDFAPALVAGKASLDKQDQQEDYFFIWLRNTATRKWLLFFSIIWAKKVRGGEK